MLILTSHVDDCTITGTSSELIHTFKDEIGSQFKITGLGPISWLLGMKVVHDRDARTITLSQEPIVEAILAKYNFSDTKPISVPMDPSVQYSRDQCPTTAA